MLSEFVIWQGLYTGTYQDELDEWFSARGDIDSSIFRCTEIDLSVAESEEHPLFLDSGNLFSGRTILLLSAHEWGSVAAKKVAKKLDSFDSDIRLSMVFNGGVPSEGLVNMGTEPLRERIIPWDPDDMAEWIVSFLQRNQILVSTAEAMKVVSHVGYDAGKLVEGVQAAVVIFRNKRVTGDDIVKLCGIPGELEVLDLIKAVASGDRALSAEMMKRFQGFDPFQLRALIGNKFRIYAALAWNRDCDLDVFGMSSGAQYYARKEFGEMNMKKGQIAKALEAIGNTDNELKNGEMASVVTGYSRTMINIMVDTLTIIFSKAHQSARR